MADKRELQIFPNKDDTSIVLSDGRNSLAARGRKDVASLLLTVIRKRIFPVIGRQGLCGLA